MYSSIYYYNNLMNPVFSYENNNDGAYMNEQYDLHEITLYNSNKDENMIYMLLFFYLLSCYMATFYMYKYGVFNVDDDDNCADAAFGTRALLVVAGALGTALPPRIGLRAVGLPSICNAMPLKSTTIFLVISPRPY